MLIPSVLAEVGGSLSAAAGKLGISRDRLRRRLQRRLQALGLYGGAE